MGKEKKQRNEALQLQLEGRFFQWIASVFLLMIFADNIIAITPVIAAVTFFVTAFLLLVSVFHYFVVSRRMAPLHMCLYILAILFVSAATIIVGVAILKE